MALAAAAFSVRLTRIFGSIPSCLPTPQTFTPSNSVSLRQGLRSVRGVQQADRALRLQRVADCPSDVGGEIGPVPLLVDPQRIQLLGAIDDPPTVLVEETVQ